MGNLQWEKRAAERRAKERGVERASASGYTLEALGRARRGVARAEAFIEEARRWEPIEEVVERNTAFEERRRASKGSGSPLREILDACED